MLTAKRWLRQEVVSDCALLSWLKLVLFIWFIRFLTRSEIFFDSIDDAPAELHACPWQLCLLNINCFLLNETKRWRVNFDMYLRMSQYTWPPLANHALNWHEPSFLNAFLLYLADAVNIKLTGPESIILLYLPVSPAGITFLVYRFVLAFRRIERYRADKNGVWRRGFTDAHFNRIGFFSESLA